MPQMSKDELRLRLTEQRRALTDLQRERFGSAIVERCLKTLEREKIESLHSYAPISSKKEVDTRQLLKAVWRRWPKIVTAAPRVTGVGLLESVVVNADTEWREHAWGMPEPIEGEVVPRDYQFDAIIVPTLGFDRHGYRLGYGGGYYDRFLDTQRQALTIGLCYQAGFVESGLQHEDHDVLLNLVITERATYRFSRHTS